MIMINLNALYLYTQKFVFVKNVKNFIVKWL